MTTTSRLGICAVCVALLGSYANGATVTGTVKGPDGKAFKGAFVQVENAKNHIVVSVLSDREGQFRVDNLAAGDYDFKIRAIGYRSDPRTGVSLTADQKASYDFALQKGMVHWTDLSNYQGAQLLPEGPGKKTLTTTCFSCHGFQTRIASAVRDESGWQDRVNFMRTKFWYFLRNLKDQDYANVTSYLAKNFGPDSDLPKSPADLPGYKDVAQAEFSDAAMRLVTVTYPLPGPDRFPGSAQPMKDGNVWIWTYNHAQFDKLDPKTGVVTEYAIPNPNDHAGNHSVTMAPDGIVWFTEADENNTIGKLDPATGKITQYHPTVPGNKHTIVVDSKGFVWLSASPVSRFDPKTETWTYFAADAPSSYGITVDHQDNVWFSDMGKGKIGKIDATTGKVTRYDPPTPNSGARRIHADAKGTVWFAEYRTGQISSFDPETEKFKEYPLPGANPTPYGLAIDARNHVWYSSMDMDVIGELDPATGKVIEYPFIYSENNIRDFFPGSDGRIWWGSESHNHVGYFYLAPAGLTTQSTSSARDNTANKAKPASNPAPSTAAE